MTPDVERFEALVSALLARDSTLSPIGAALLVACDEGLAADSRSASNRLGLAHALVLREVQALGASGLLVVTKRDARTMRTFYTVSDGVRPLLHRAGNLDGSSGPGRLSLRHEGMDLLLPHTIAPDADALLRFLAADLDDADLHAIASADYGDDIDAHLAELLKLGRGPFPAVLAWQPREVLELIRWKTLSHEAVYERAHRQRAFAAAALLRAYGEPGNQHCLDGENQSLAVLIDSLRALIAITSSPDERVAIANVDEPAAAFLIWLIPRLPESDEGEHAFFGLGLLWFALPLSLTDAEIEALSEWVILVEARAALRCRVDGIDGSPRRWLVDTSCFNLRHELWQALGTALPERTPSWRGPSVQEAVHRIAGLLGADP